MGTNSNTVMRNSSTNTPQVSCGSLSSLESDRWSRRGISSRVSINLGGSEQAEENDDEDTKKKRCFWFHQLWGNVILSGIFGIDRYRFVKRLLHKHPISKQLLENVMSYNSIVRGFITNDLLTEMKPFATQLYFPTGQIEADGLSVISAEIWAATYLLLCIHKRMREADFHSIRNAYSSLAWDSGQVYSEVLRFHQVFLKFRRQVVPAWREIEKLVGIPENGDFLPANIDVVPSSFTFNKQSTKEGNNPTSAPCLPSVRLSDELIMQNRLGLRIIPEMKSALIPSESTEKDFNELDYGRQIEIIQELLAKPAGNLANVPAVLKRIELNLQTDGVGSPTLPDNDVTCTRAMKILTETLKLIYKEVKLTPSLRFDIYENIRATSEDLHAFIAYGDWVTSKISEFHSMLRLCYNFALLCFDLDLPNFDKVLTQEKVSEGLFEHLAMDENGLQDERLEFKAASLTKLMMEATVSFASVQKQGEMDENFAWEDFYKTEYHMVLQRLPLRLGFNLLQFSAKPDAKLCIQQRLGTTSPDFSTEETVTEVPRRLWSIYRKEERHISDRAGYVEEHPIAV